MRVRGNAYQVMEKYLALARDASAAGDRIAMENYLQHAEHYYRVLNANGEAHRGRQQEMRRDGGHGANGTQPVEGYEAQPEAEAQPKATAIAEPVDDSDA
jgi:hypothetical protein